MLSIILLYICYELKNNTMTIHEEIAREIANEMVNCSGNINIAKPEYLIELTVKPTTYSEEHEEETNLHECSVCLEVNLAASLIALDENSEFCDNDICKIINLAAEMSGQEVLIV